MEKSTLDERGQAYILTVMVDSTKRKGTIRFSDELEKQWTL